MVDMEGRTKDILLSSFTKIFVFGGQTYHTVWVTDCASGASGYDSQECEGRWSPLLQDSRDPEVGEQPQGGTVGGCKCIS